MSKKILPLLLGVLCFAILPKAQPVINISNATANNGETVTINLTVNNYTNYISLEFALNWDPSVINYVGVSNLTSGLPGFTEASSINLQQNGILNVSWFENNITPTSLPNGTNLFTITFEVTGGACDSTGLTIPNVEIADENEEVAATIVNPGFVRVPGSGCGTFNGVEIIGETKTVNSGSNVCIKFTSKGFNDVVAGSYTITFNPAVIRYTGIQNINWPELIPGTTYSDAEALSGILRVVWTDPDVQGIDIPDGTVLYELCFDAIGGGGSMSQIGFGNSPVMIEFADGDSEPLAFQGTPGKINIEGELEGFGLILPDVNALPDQEVCLPITVHDFIDILAMQFSINWDSTVLEFVRFQNFGLNGLAESVAGPEGVGNNAAQAVCAWFDNNVTGVSLSNGAVLMEICFKVIGECGESSPVVFSSTPSEIEIADANGDPIDYTLIDGDVDIDCNSPCAVVVTHVTDVCAGDELGSIDITVSGNCASPVTFLWSTGAPTEDLIGVPPGKYVVTVTVGGNMFIIPDTIMIVQLDPIQVSASITDVVNGNDGAVNITVTGGKPGYAYLWSANAFMGEDLTGVAAGNYTVTITDINGCTFVAGPFTVADGSGSADIMHVKCFGECNGSINLTNVTCVDPPFSYQWSANAGGATTAVVTNLCAGTYSVTVTGSGGATCTQSFQILQAPSAINIAVDTMNETSQGNDGAIDLTVSGGQPPYSYQWSNSLPPTQDQMNLTAGSYTVTVSDQFGCNVVQTILIRGNALYVDIVGSSYNGFGVSCTGECDGDLIAMPGNGVGALTYLWNNSRTTQSISDLCPGTYFVTVTDALGQTATQSFVVAAPPPVLVQVQLQCASEPGSLDGGATVQVSGGVQPYFYSWNNNTHDAFLQNVPSGPYQVVVTDDNNCEKVQPVFIHVCGTECYQAISVITPNGDGKNDYLTINCVYDLPNILSIYNRYGGLVYRMDNYDNSWDGVDEGGDILSDGGYHWVLQVFLPGGGFDVYKGTVSLVRSLD